MARAKKSAKTATRKPARTKSTLGDPVDPKFAAVMDAFAGDRRVTSGKMMASMGLKLNGKIFAMMVRGKFVAKLSKARVDELVQAGVGEYFDPRHDGRLMKEWIVLKGNKPPWLEVAKEAYGFVKNVRD